MTNKLTGTLQLIACLILTGATQPAPCQTIEIKMGTVVPEGSVWHEVIQTMAQQWRQISDGKVEMRIYPGGVLGGEVDMLRKVRVGQLQAVALSAVGLSHVDRSASCMGVPMLIESYEELDHVRAEVAPMIEERFRENGYVVLMWSDAGWVHFFTKKPARTLDDIREMKLWIGAGDAEAEQLYKEFGINPVPLPMTDMLTSLETGIIDAIQVPPLFALVDQSFALTKNMVDVKWAPLVAATVVRRRDWERIPAELRPRLLDAARRAGARLRGDIRRQGDDAILEMEKRGLQVYHADAAMVATWRAEAERAYPRIRGTIVPADVFDRVVRARDEFRRQRRNANTDGN